MQTNKIKTLLMESTVFRVLIASSVFLTLFYVAPAPVSDKQSRIAGQLQQSSGQSSSSSGQSSSVSAPAPGQPLTIVSAPVDDTVAPVVNVPGQTTPVVTTTPTATPETVPASVVSTGPASTTPAPSVPVATPAPATATATVDFNDNQNVSTPEKPVTETKSVVIEKPVEKKNDMTFDPSTTENKPILSLDEILKK